MLRATGSTQSQRSGIMDDEARIATMLLLGLKDAPFEKFDPEELKHKYTAATSNSPETFDTAKKDEPILIQQKLQQSQIMAAESTPLSSPRYAQQQNQQDQQQKQLQKPSASSQNVHSMSLASSPKLEPVPTNHHNLVKKKFNDDIFPFNADNLDLSGKLSPSGKEQQLKQDKQSISQNSRKQHSAPLSNQPKVASALEDKTLPKQGSSYVPQQSQLKNQIKAQASTKLQHGKLPQDQILKHSATSTSSLREQRKQTLANGKTLSTSLAASESSDDNLSDNSKRKRKVKIQQELVQSTTPLDRAQPKELSCASGSASKKKPKKSKEKSTSSLIPAGTDVACMVKVKDEDTDELNWILAKIVKYNAEARKYQVIDAGEGSSEEEKLKKKGKKRKNSSERYFLVGKTRIRPLQEPHENLDIEASLRVLAVYPDTTVFYPATVRESAKRRKNQTYLVEFDDEDPYEGGPKTVHARYVLSYQD